MRRSTEWRKEEQTILDNMIKSLQNEIETAETVVQQQVCVYYKEKLLARYMKLAGI